MRSVSTRLAGLLTVVALTITTGCQGAGLRLLSLVGLKKELVMVAFVLEHRTEPPKDLFDWANLNPAKPYVPLLAAMEESIGRPVGYDYCFPIQIAPNFELGLCDLAVVSPTQYARLRGQKGLSVLAVSVDARGRAARAGLLVVARNSQIQSIEDLRDRTVAFGPAGDARTHYAALKLLKEHGISKTDLALEVLPVPGSLKHMPHMRAVAQSVVNGSSDAGLLDEAAWEAFPARDPRENEPARAEMRIIARTVAVPERLVIASSKLGAETIEKVRGFLLGVGETRPEVLKMLFDSGFREPSDELLAVCADVFAAGTE